MSSLEAAIRNDILGVFVRLDGLKFMMLLAGTDFIIGWIGNDRLSWKWETNDILGLVLFELPMKLRVEL